MGWRVGELVARIGRRKDLWEGRLMVELAYESGRVDGGRTGGQAGGRATESVNWLTIGNNLSMDTMSPKIR